jgi:hypothetical protein
MSLAGSAPLALLSGMILPLCAMALALGLSKLFRQKFFLDPDAEHGIHWRAAVLRWAKWPQMLLALKDVLSRRQRVYTITAKSNENSTDLSWLWPHVLAATLLTVCWIIGVGLGTRELRPWHCLIPIVVLATAGLCVAGRGKSNPTFAPQSRGQSGTASTDSQRPAEV